VDSGLSWSGLLVRTAPGPTQGFEGTICPIPPPRASSESADGVVTVQLSPAEFEAVQRIQTLDSADQRLVYRSRHVRRADRGLGH
jgi:hypothetical protein